MHWQKNPLAIVPLVGITKNWPYDSHYRTGTDRTLSVLQDWCLSQVGKTFRLLPAKVINLPLPAEEYYARPNFYYDFRDHLLQKAYYDSTGQRIEFCNHKRLYVLFATGEVRTLANMAGRSSWSCSPAPDNALEPWGPGVTGGPSAWAMELIRGNVAGLELIDGSGLRLENKMRGALLHEMMHCIGVQHPTEDEYGPEAWLSPMAGWWFFGSSGKFLPQEIEYLSNSPFFS